MPLKKVHRHDDARVCGATTIATDHKVFANNKLIAVNGDVYSHGGGALVAGSNNVYCGGIRVVIHTRDGSAADSLCPLAPHCAPVTAAGAPDVFVGD